jgi:hypothetical protein
MIDNIIQNASNKTEKAAISFLYAHFLPFALT